MDTLSLKVYLRL